MARGADGEALEGCGGAVEAVEGQGEGRGSGGGERWRGQGNGGRAVGKMARREFLQVARLAPPRHMLLAHQAPRCDWCPGSAEYCPT